MINPKNICISAAVGFLLSFVIGLLFGVSFLHVIIRAVFFAALFAALYAGITYLYKTFLSGSFSFEADNAPSSDGNSPKPSSGGIVNIVVDDSTLKDDSTAPKFSVTDDNIFKDEALARQDSSPVSKNQYQKNGQEANPSKPAEKAEPVFVPEAKPAEPEKSQKQGAEFVASDLSSMTSPAAAQADSKAEPGPETETADTKASADAKSLADEKETKASDDENETQNVDDSEDIDELPDIGGIDFSSNPSSLDSSSDSVIEDSEFATEGSPRPSAAAADTGGQNIDTMAQAIRTLLAKDNE